MQIRYLATHTHTLRPHSLGRGWVELSLDPTCLNRIGHEEALPPIKPSLSEIYLVTDSSKLPYLLSFIFKRKQSNFLKN